MFLYPATKIKTTTVFYVMLLKSCVSEGTLMLCLVEGGNCDEE